MITAGNCKCSGDVKSSCFREDLSRVSFRFTCFISCHVFKHVFKTVSICLLFEM